MTEPVARMPSDGSTHGFPFADLRGYAQLVDTRGALDASHVLERYRAIVREVVARDGGAEIKTEGDSFFEDGARTLTVVYTGRADVLPAFESGLGVACSRRWS
jgi:class 3 adenylate cyclase